MSTDLELAIGAGAALFLAVYPLAIVILEELDRRRQVEAAFEANLRRYGARPAGERKLEQLGRLVDVDPDLEEHYGTVIIPGDRHVPPGDATWRRPFDADTD